RDQWLQRWTRPLDPAPHHPDGQLHHRHRAAVRRPRPERYSQPANAVRLEELPLLLAAQQRQPHVLRRPGEFCADDDREGPRLPLYRETPWFLPAVGWYYAALDRL